MSRDKIPVLPRFRVARKPPLNLISEDTRLFEREFSREFGPCEAERFSNISFNDQGVPFRFKYFVFDNLCMYNILHWKGKFKLAIKRAFKFANVKGRRLWISEYWGDGFFHWPLDTFVKLFVLPKGLDGITLLLPARYQNHPYVTEPLNKLGVVEIRSEDDCHNNCYFSLASALDLNYYYVKGKPVNQRQDLHVNVLALESLLMKIKV